MLTSEKKSEDNYIGIRTCVLIKSTIQQIDTIEGLRQVHSVERLVASLHKAFRPQSLYGHYHYCLYGTAWRPNPFTPNHSHVSVRDVRYRNRHTVKYT